MALTMDESAMILAGNKSVILSWVFALIELLSCCIPRPQFSTSFVEDPDWVEQFSGRASEDSLKLEGRSAINCDKCGWMHKKGETKNMVLGSEYYRKCYFVLNESRLDYYKTASQAHGDIPTGTILLKDAIEVVPSTSPSAPQFALEVITSERVFVVVPENSKEHKEWLTLLKDAVDAYALNEEISSRGIKGISSWCIDDDERVSEIKRSIIMDGTLIHKSDRAGTVTWKKRYFVLTLPQLAYYEDHDDIFKEDSDPLGSLPIHQVTSVMSSNESSVTAGYFFEVTVNSNATEFGKTGGTGERTYTLGAISKEVAIQWMQSICKIQTKVKLTITQQKVSKDQMRNLNAFKQTSGKPTSGRGGARGRGRGTHKKTPGLKNSKPKKTGHVGGSECSDIAKLDKTG